LKDPASVDTTGAPHFRGDFALAPPSDGVGRTEEGPSDVQLVSRVLAGDTDAYRPLVERYQRAALGLASRLLGPGGDAEDLAQEAFVRAFRYLRSLKEPDRFGPWLYQVVRSLCRDRNRKRQAERRALLSKKEMERWASIPAGNGMGSELYRLPPLEYQALRLRYFDELSYEEIAHRMEKTFSQVDHLIRKARAHLARKLSREVERERSL